MKMLQVGKRLLCLLLVCCCFGTMGIALPGKGSAEGNANWNAWVRAGDEFTFGSYEQDANMKNGQEPIEWIVMSVDRVQGTVLALSKYCLDVQVYNKNTKETSWSKSHIRKWLNSTFYSAAFTAEEQDILLSTSNHGSSDYVFLLDQKQINTYLTNKKVKATAYAVKQGIFVDNANKSSWWVRKGSTSTWGVYVGSTGKIRDNNNKVTAKDNGIRPAITMPISYFLVDDSALMYDAADAAGTVVNGEQGAKYAFTPVDVVLVLDVSGSMSGENAETGKTLLNYAQDAAAVFVRTLYALNPDSRIGFVCFDDTARSVSSIQGKEEQQMLLNLIRHTFPGGQTNTGAGFGVAGSMLNEEGVPGRRRMVLMITDGLANRGSDDPVSFAITKGWEAARTSNVYTIGLVGGLDEESKQYTRRVLSAGYESRYYEVDFDSVGNMGTMLTNIMTMLPIAVSANETVQADGSVEATKIYRLTVGKGYQATVRAGDVELTTDKVDAHYLTPFGSLSVVDGEQTFVMLDGDYEIDIKGVSTKNTGYTLEMISGTDMEERILVDQSEWSHISIHRQISLADGKAQVIDLSYNPLDARGLTDEGKPITGIQTLSGAVVDNNMTVLAAPNAKAQPILQIPKMSRVKVLAHDHETGYSLVNFSSENGRIARGWIKTVMLSNQSGFVADAPYFGGEYTMLANTQAYLYPDTRAELACTVERGATVELVHVDRDEDGNEWAYVSVPGKRQQWAYVPVEALQGWKTVAPEKFRIGTKDPVIDAVIDFQRVSVARDLMLPVYSGPSEASWRGANNKAVVSTSGGLYAAGWVDNNWLLVMYGTTAGNRRVGYIHGEVMPNAFANLPLLNFDRRMVTVAMKCSMTDDPENYSETIMNLKKGDQVILLAEYDGFEGGDPFYYVETEINNKLVRGLIPYGYADE